MAAHHTHLEQHGHAWRAACHDCPWVSPWGTAEGAEDAADDHTAEVAAAPAGVKMRAFCLDCPDWKPPTTTERKAWREARAHAKQRGHSTGVHYGPNP